MAWYRVGGGGLPNSIKTDMNNVLNKKFGTSTTYPPNEWADEVNLMGMLEEKTIVSSPIADFSDGADDVPTKSLVVTIAPTLSGVSSITEKQTGRNVRQNVTDYSSVNPVFFQYRNYYAGQATGYPKLEGTFKAGTYTLSFDTSASITASKVGVWAKKKSDQNWYNLSANGDLVTPTSSGYSFCSASSGHVTGTFKINEECDALGFGYYQYGTSIPYTNLMLEFGSTAHAYEPYQTPTVYTASLGRTIYGGTADIVNGVGTDGYGYIVFDGSSDENWGGYSAYNGYYIGISDMKSGTRQDGVCNQLTCSQSTAQGQTDAFWLGVGNARLYVIGVYDSMGNTLEAFRAYLAENPLILVYPLATPTDFTFTGQDINTRLGYNAFWSDSGDTEVRYRSSGTITPVVPTLISKTITENGTYSAEDDGADGYSTVIVNVPSQEVNVTPLSSNRVYLYPDDISGTNVERTAQTLTATGTGKYVFASDTATYTNTSSNDGYVGVKKNGTFVVKQNLNTDVKVPYTIPDIDVVAGDEVSIVVGFANYHTSCYFEIYTAIAFVEEVTS